MTKYTDWCPSFTIPNWCPPTPAPSGGPLHTKPTPIGVLVLHIDWFSCTCRSIFAVRSAPHTELTKIKTVSNWGSGGWERNKLKKWRMERYDVMTSENVSNCHVCILEEVSSCEPWSHSLSFSKIHLIMKLNGTFANPFWRNIRWTWRLQAFYKFLIEVFQWPSARSFFIFWSVQEKVKYLAKTFQCKEIWDIIHRLEMINFLIIF